MLVRLKSKSREALAGRPLSHSRPTSIHKLNTELYVGISSNAMMIPLVAIEIFRARPSSDRERLQLGAPCLTGVRR